MSNTTTAPATTAQPGARAGDGIPAGVPMCSEQAVLHALTMARGETHKQGDAALWQAFGHAMWRQFNAMLASAPAASAPVELKAQALALCHALEEQPGSQYQTAAVLAAFKVYRAFESIEKHGEIRQWVFDVAAPAVSAPAWQPGSPLTEEQIVNDGLMMCQTKLLDNCADAFEAGVKFAERAHGISSPVTAPATNKD